MDKSGQLKVTQRLILGFSILTLIFILFGLYTIFYIHEISGLTRTIYDHPLVVSNEALQASISIIKIHRTMKDVVFHTSASDIDRFMKTINEQEKQTYKHFDLIKKTILGDEGKRLENEARKLFDGRWLIREQIIQLVLRGEKDKATAIIIGKEADHIALLEKKMFELTNYARNKASDFMDQADEARFRMNAILILFLVLGTLVSILVTILIFKQTRSAENKLMKNQYFLEKAQEIGQIGTWELDTKSNKLFWTNETYKIFGIPIGTELTYETFLNYIHPDDKEYVDKKWKASFNKKPYDIEHRLLVDGKVRWIREKAELEFNQEGKCIRGTGVAQDITGRKNAENKIKKALAEKKILLRELYHRTKNNMQVIMSMISLQTQNIDDKNILQMFKETMNRIKSMALVHEKLYQTKDLSEIDLKDYFTDLINVLTSSYKDMPEGIRIKTDMDRVMVTIDSAIPCGLIMNELISNAYKHAFPENQSGEIIISLKMTGDKEIELIVSDDGVGLPKKLDIRNAETFGLQSIVALAEHQLSGSFKVVTGKGAQFQITFKKLSQKKRSLD